MKDILSGWREHGVMKNKRMIIMLSLIVFLIMSSGLIYHFYQKKVEADNLEKQRLQLIANEKKKISDFYIKESNGYQYHDLLKILEQIMFSRYALTMSGFSEESFHCDTQDCHFLYKLRQGAVYNVQEKLFFNENYEGTISPDSIEFSNLSIKYNANESINKIISSGENTPLCNDYINYVYAFNSTKKNQDDQITLIDLPSSSVTNLEEKYSDYIDSHNLLFASFEMIFDENPAKIKSILDRQPYINFYIFNSIEKFESNKIKVTGVFTCTR